MKITLNWLILLSLLCFNTSHLPAQNISGVWEGNYSKSVFMVWPDKLVVEINRYNDSMIFGASHLYYGDNTYEHYTIIGKYHAADSTIEFLEDSILAIKLGFLITNCQGNYTMKLRKDGSDWVFEGDWRDRSRKLFHCPRLDVHLRKPVDPDELDTLQLMAVKERPTTIQSLIEYKISEKDSIKIEIYDNGEIDDDSISLYLNDEQLIPKSRISGEAIVAYITLNAKMKFNKLKLKAENLGSIPPCTALLIITTKNNRYQVNLSSDLETNAAVEFFLKE